MKTILPFRVNCTPMSKLALINFEKEPDDLYSGLELQYIDGVGYGTGYRVLAYRTDGYVDMYDDATLIFNPNEKCDVTQKGLKNHLQVPFKSPVFSKENGNVHIEFTFSDILQRKIKVRIKEQSRKKSVPMNLLAPVGVGSVKPSFMPVFFLYDFDFVRRGKTLVSVTIGERQIKLDPFPAPIPMGGQWRFYARYSLDSQIIEFLPTDGPQPVEIELDDKLQYRDKSTIYHFEKTEKGVSLSFIEVKGAKPVKISFSPAFSLDGGAGSFSIEPLPEMGHIDGMYEVENEPSTIRIKIIPDKGWKSKPNSFITKMLFSPKSMFCSWSRKYRYSQTIDKISLKSEAIWTNDNI